MEQSREAKPTDYQHNNSLLLPLHIPNIPDDMITATTETLLLPDQAEAHAGQL